MEFDSPEARAWLAEIEIVTDSESGREKEKGRSFRYESMHGHASFTARNQPIKGISYFYGSKKVAGNVNKIYIGKLKDLTIARLEEVAQEIAKPKPEKVVEELSNPEPKAVGDKKVKAVANRIPEAVGQESNSRIEALEAQIAEMRAEMQQALEELRGKLVA
jgi:HAMP domain-containing protein